MNRYRNFFLANAQRIKLLFTRTQRVVTYALKNSGMGSGNQDPRSGIQKKPFPNPDPGVKKGTRSRMPEPDPQHCYLREEKKLDERSVPTTRRHWAGRKIWLVRAGESITSFKEYLDVINMY